MEICSLKLIEREIEKLESKEYKTCGISYQERIALNQYRKELALLRKIVVDANMMGNYEEFIEKLAVQNVYLIEPDIYEYMMESACKFSEIKDICNEKK